MTKKQVRLIERIEALIMSLHFTDRKDKARSEMERLKRSLRELEDALNK